MKSTACPGLLLLALTSVGVAAEMQPPRLSFTQVDWSAATASLAGIEALQPASVVVRRPAQGGPARPVSRALERINAVMAPRFAGIASSPVPVLLPFDTEMLLREQADGTASSDDDRYLSVFHTAKFFYPGPSGYDAAFVIQTSEVPELAEYKFKDSIEVQISGSALLYELDSPTAAIGTPVPGLEADFPGIRRLMLEHHLRYTFVRFGVPYSVSVTCFDASASRYRMPTCRTADQVALRFLRALHLAGGSPQKLRPARPLPVERPAKVSETFTYYPPGRLLTGTDVRGRGGRPDNTVYAQIRFPLEEAPAYANSQMYQGRNRSSDPRVSANYAYPWRDNFCERRAFPVGQCPAGFGHQGQDIRPARCVPPPGADRCTPNHALVAVRDGVILRSPKQEAAFLFVNTASEHIRFRYLHMNPNRMDEEQLLSGRRVHEGEVIGHVSNFSNREAGTSYHLHFDIQVPTKDGWVFVNPYMTLVASFERLIDERGTEIEEPVAVSIASAETTGSLPVQLSGPGLEKAGTDGAKPAVAAVSPTTKLASAVPIMRPEPRPPHQALSAAAHRKSPHRESSRREPSHRALAHRAHRDKSEARRSKAEKHAAHRDRDWHRVVRQGRHQFKKHSRQASR